ncbi:MAG: flavoprotein [Meiothermus sp.]|uniref:flavoprotein n=1 Tax=Meiothermus sp. TaxID=1955249 RepID=UPI00298F0DB8|nr:flavoprotein [Meiothermus sp.]MDW8091992.1 flavoprotein [Meiothermus sp.]
MVVMPCSATPLSKLAPGIADNLLTRAAYVHTQEHRLLIPVPREAPLAIPTLGALLKAAQAGATILPAAPGLHTREDLPAFVTLRVLDLSGTGYPRAPRWKGPGPLVTPVPLEPAPGRPPSALLRAGGHFRDMLRRMAGGVPQGPGSHPLL